MKKGASGAVVINAYISGLDAVRSLGSHNIPVAVVHNGGYNDFAQYSCSVCEDHKLPDFISEPESLLELLERQGRAWQDWVIFPADDQALAVISRYRDRLSRWYRITVPPWEVTRHLLEKDLTYQAASEVGVDIPHSYGNATRQNAKRDDISFPVVVKPVESHLFVKHFGRKLFVVRNRDELLRRVNAVANAGLRAQIFDLVPGPDTLFYNYSVYIDHSGEPVAELDMKKLRKSPPFFGVIRAGERAHVPELREPTIELLRKLKWCGMANAEYKLDRRDGRYRLMEINGRCFMMMGLARKAGVNYPLLAWQECGLGEKKVGAHPNTWWGVWVHLLADAYYGIFHSKIEGLGLASYFESYRRPKTFAVWLATDPKPFIVQWAKAAQRAARLSYRSYERERLRAERQHMPAE
jgi:predicted ATP-grasp superfamily ATP-dependent carboligase